MDAKSSRSSTRRSTLTTHLNLDTDDIKLALRPAEAARAISVSVRTLHTLIKNKEIKAAKMNRAVFIPVAELESFLNRHMNGENDTNG